MLNTSEEFIAIKRIVEEEFGLSINEGGATVEEDKENFSPPQYTQGNLVEKKSMIGPIAWSAIGGGVATLIIGFSMGWLVTGSTAAQLTARGELAGILKVAVPICLERIQRTTDYPARQEAFGKLDNNWARTTYVRDGKFSHLMLDGKSDDNYVVGEACAAALLKLVKK